MLIFHSTGVEPDHAQFAEDALTFFQQLAQKDGFAADASTDWNDLNAEKLQNYQLVVWLNDSPKDSRQRQAFQNYMEHGGAWLGFHAAGYNDNDTQWPWYVDFLGGAVFYINSWPPLPADVAVENGSHPATEGLPSRFVSPTNEWYVWKPSPRENKDVQVLLTVDAANYPLGLKDIIETGDLPAVWTNTKYKMVYMNMGHGGEILTSPVQNQLIENAVLWLGGAGARPKPQAATARVVEATGRRVSPSAVAVNAKTNKIYAVNTSSGTVTIVDGATHGVSRIKVGTDPSAIAINAATNRVYVGNQGGTVSVVDGSADQVLASVDVGALPYVIAVNQTANNLYVAKTFSNTLTLVNGASNQASTLKINLQADAIAVDQERNKSYLMNYEDNDVSILDGATDALRKVRVGNHLWGIGINPGTHKLYFGGTGGSFLTILDAVGETVRQVSVGEIPCAIAVDPGANRAYVANCAGNSVSVLDGGDDRVLATVAVGKHPQAIAADPVAHQVYVANTGSHSITVLNGANNSVAGTVELPSGPFAIAVDSAHHTGYAKVFGTEDLIAIDGATLTAKRLAASSKP